MQDNEPTGPSGRGSKNIDFDQKVVIFSPFCAIFYYFGHFFTIFEPINRWILPWNVFGRESIITLLRWARNTVRVSTPGIVWSDTRRQHFKRHVARDTIPRSRHCRFDPDRSATGRESVRNSSMSFHDRSKWWTAVSWRVDSASVVCQWSRPACPMDHWIDGKCSCIVDHWSHWWKWVNI